MTYPSRDSPAMSSLSSWSACSMFGWPSVVVDRTVWLWERAERALGDGKPERWLGTHDAAGPPRLCTQPAPGSGAHCRASGSAPRPDGLRQSTETASIRGSLHRPVIAAWRGGVVGGSSETPRGGFLPLY